MSSGKKIAFIINPKAGRKKNINIQRTIEKFFASKSQEFEIHLTKHAGHAKELSHSLSSKGYQSIIAAGGDGTVNEVINGLHLNNNIPLGIIPLGSGNGLARHLKIPLKIIPALKLITLNQTKTIDLIDINSLKMANVSGVGFDALIAQKFKESQTRGFVSYLKICLKEFLRYQAKNYSLTIDGKTKETDAFMISIANSAQFGNNILISPDASINDGFIDLCIVKPFPKYKIFFLMILLLMKKIHTCRYLKIIKAKKITISQNDNNYHLDGESLLSDQPLKVNIDPSSLKIIAPK